MNIITQEMQTFRFIIFLIVLLCQRHQLIFGWRNILQFPQVRLLQVLCSSYKVLWAYVVTFCLDKLKNMGLLGCKMDILSHSSETEINNHLALISRVQS